MLEKKKLLALILGGGFFLFLLWLIFAPPKQVGYSPKQPIPFDHSFHVGKLGLDCRYCHTGVLTSKAAGVPSLNICMNCHIQAGFTKPNVKRLVRFFSRKKAIEWIKVHDMPDFVHFSHRIHVWALWNREKGEPLRNVCVRCHGEVWKMKQVTQVESLNMGFCISCHVDMEDKGAKTNCSTCHF